MAETALRSRLAAGDSSTSGVASSSFARPNLPTRATTASASPATMTWTEVNERIANVITREFNNQSETLMESGTSRTSVSRVDEVILMVYVHTMDDLASSYPNLRILLRRPNLLGFNLMSTEQNAALSVG